MPRVSVVIPTYNQAAYICEAIRSVLDQTYQDFEIVIVNDASSDRTIEKVLENPDPRIRLFNFEQNQGESTATNYGIQQARGDLIAILHSDDIFVAEKLEKQVKFLDENPQFSAVLTYPRRIDSRGEELPPSNSFIDRIFFQENRSRFQWLNYFFWKDNCFCQTSSLIRKSCYQEIGFYDRRFRQLGDFDFWVRFCLKYEPYILPEPLVNYRVHQSNLSVMKPETFIRHHFELSQVLKQYFCLEVYENLLKIFPDCLEPGEQLEPDLADFLLARQLLKVERSPHRYLSLEAIFNLLGNPQKSHSIKQHYNFDYLRLRDLTGSFEIFNFTVPKDLKNEAQNERTASPGFSPQTVQNNPQFPRVSIIIPTYNGETFLAEAIASALSQTYPNLEIILSDDGSGDNTLEIARSFQQKSSRPFSILPHKNYGLVQNLNFSISQARGKYIKFLFQDDLLEPDCIAAMVDLAETDPEIGLVFSPRRVFIASDSQADPLCQAASNGAKDLHQKWSNLKPIQPGKELLSDPNCLKGTINKIGEPTTVLIPKTVFDKIGGFDPNLHQLLDGDLWLRIMGNYKIGFVNRTLSSLRIHRQQQTQKNISAGENLKDYDRLYEKILFHPDYRFLSADFQSQILQKLMAKTREYFPLSQKLIEQYQNNPFLPAARAHLRQIRQTIAQRWLALSIDELKRVYEGDLGETHRALIRCGLVEEKLTDSEEIFVQRLTQQVARGFQEVQGIQAVLAAMLYQKAYQLPLQYQNALIPKYIFQDFLEFLFAEWKISPPLEERKQFFEFLENLLHYIVRHLKTETNNPVWLYIASVYSQLAPAENWKLSSPQQNLKNLYGYRADIVAFYLQKTGQELDYNFASNSSQNSKIYLGILLDKIGFNSDTFAVIPIIKNLDLTQFELVVYYFQIENGNLGELCKDLKQPPVQLPETLKGGVDRIRQDRLDFLVCASDVTAKADPIFKLALHRLARKQLVGPAHSTAGAIRNLDGIVAGELTQPRNERDLDKGRVISLPGSGLCWSVPKELPRTTPEPTRSSWGAGRESVIFAGVGKLKAIAPEFRGMWGEILAAVPQSMLVLIPQASEDPNEPVGAFFRGVQSDLNRRGIDPQRFVMLEPTASWGNLRKRLNLADIYLHLYPNAEPLWIAEALRGGVVPVVWGGDSWDRRGGAALLMELGIPELIAPTAEVYLQLGVALGTQPEKRREYSRKIDSLMQNNPPFFDGQAYTRRWEGVLKNLHQQP